jgi:hypothetical protein
VNHRVDDKLTSEILRYKLVYTCDRCAQHDPEGDRCTLGIPRDQRPIADLSGRREMAFCKSFELW